LLLLFFFPPLSPPSLAAKVLVVINRPRPRLKVLPSSLLPLAHNPASFKKGVFVSALIPAFFVKTTTFREEEEEEAQEAQDNAARIYLFSLSRESRKVPQATSVCPFFLFLLI
jgi:hypothetical protein